MSDLLSNAEPLVTIADEVLCAERELRLRMMVYPRQVAIGRMSQGSADREIAMMRAIVTRLKAIARG